MHYFLYFFRYAVTSDIVIFSLITLAAVVFVAFLTSSIKSKIPKIIIIALSLIAIIVFDVYPFKLYPATGLIYFGIQGIFDFIFLGTIAGWIIGDIKRKKVK